MQCVKSASKYHHVRAESTHVESGNNGSVEVVKLPHRLFLGGGLRQRRLGIEHLQELCGRTLRILLKDMDDLSDNLQQGVLDQVSRDEERFESSDRVRTAVIKAFDPLAQSREAEACRLSNGFRLVLYEMFKDGQLRRNKETG